VTPRPLPPRTLTPRQWWTAAVLVTVTVVAASLAPASTASGVTSGADKLMHAAGYGAIAFFVAGARNARTLRQLAVVVVAVTLIGAGVEVVQPFVGRTASVLDAFANFVGAWSGALAFEFSRSR
jgi:VanZ family protein